MAETEATLGFDAIGAGDMATLLSSMERALSRNASGLNTYGSDQHKQVYIYGRLARPGHPGAKLWHALGSWRLAVDRFCRKSALSAWANCRPVWPMRLKPLLPAILPMS